MDRWLGLSFPLRLSQSRRIQINSRTTQRTTQWNTGHTHRHRQTGRRVNEETKEHAEGGREAKPVRLLYGSTVVHTYILVHRFCIYILDVRDSRPCLNPVLTALNTFPVRILYHTRNMNTTINKYTDHSGSFVVITFTPSCRFQILIILLWSNFRSILNAPSLCHNVPHWSGPTRQR